MSAGEITSGVEVPATDDYQMSEEDKQIVISLYQKCPTLWSEFRNVTDCLDALLGDPVSYEAVAKKLVQIETLLESKRLTENQSELHSFFKFLVATGFVEQAVRFHRRILRDLGVTHLTDYHHVYTNIKYTCLRLMKDIFLNCSADSAEISLRIVQAGFVSDMMEDLKHAQHLSADVLEKNKVVLFSMGTVVNCCLHPEVKRLVKEMDLVGIVTPYLHKNNGLVDSIAIALLAHVVKEGQVDLTRIDPKLLRFFTDSVKDAVSRKNKSSGNWQIAELLLTLGLLARCDFNKRLMIADGMTERLLSVLDPSSQRNESEKLHTVNLLLELAKDENNLHVLQTYRRDFLRVMEAIQAGECKEIKELAKNFLDILRSTKDSDTDDDLSQSSDVPDLADLLADQFNLLSIVGMSHVQFVMDKLTTSHPARGDDVTKVKVLKAMAELARKGEKYRREIMARGGLTQVKTVVKDGSEDEQSYTLRVILELIASEENRLIIKSQPDLIRLLEVVTAKNLDSEEHCETAALLVTTLS